MSSYLVAVPGALSAASTDLSAIGESIRSAAASAAPSTIGIAAAAQDEVSAAIARLFGGFGQEFQLVAARTAQIHDRWVWALGEGEAAYARAEATNASPLQALVNDAMGLVNAPTEFLFGRPISGNGADGVDGTGQNGGDGGILSG
ncbi:PE family protein, partial [Mycobacterium gordonae]|uniref:PE family protein n=3 Tax=Mycobacteriaceae TaxID=1762 RepID=UPI0018D21998